MGRKVAMLWHASFSIGAGVLYFYFALPRWPELVGDISACGRDRAADRHRRADRPGRSAGGVHPVAHPQAGAGHPATGAVDQDLVDRGPRAGRGADHRHLDQRDLAQPGYSRTVVVRQSTGPPPRSRCSGSSRSTCRLSQSCHRHRRNRSSPRKPKKSRGREKRGKGDEADVEDTDEEDDEDDDETRDRGRRRRGRAPTRSPRPRADEEGRRETVEAEASERRATTKPKQKRRRCPPRQLRKSRQATEAPSREPRKQATGSTGRRSSRRKPSKHPQAQGCATVAPPARPHIGAGAPGAAGSRSTR